MKSKRTLAVFVTILTIVSILFSTTVTASAGPNDQNGDFSQYMTVYFMLTDPEDASGTMESVDVVRNSSYKLPDCKYTPAKDYMFDSYTICDAAYGSKLYKAGETIVLPDTAELYIWCNFKRDNKTVVSFVPQWDDTCSGTMDDVVVEKNKDFKAPKCTFTPAEGYVFDYWYLNAEYKVGDTINVGNKREVTLFAVFKKDQSVTIFFDNGLKGKKHRYYESELTYEIRNGKKMIELPEPEFENVTGYKFKSWKDGKIGEYVEVPAGGLPTIYAEMKEIEATKSLADCTIDVQYIENYSTKLHSSEVKIFENDIYCGKPITPIYTVKDKKGNVLKEGVDYTAEYSNNINAGTKAKIKLTGVGKYKGTKTAYFTIKKLRLSGYRSTGSGSIYYASLNINIKNINAYAVKDIMYYVYSGKTVKPSIESITVFKAAQQYEIPLSNFTIDYAKNSKDIGAYEMKINAGGNNVEIVKTNGKKNDYLSFKYYIVPPQQHIGTAKVEKSGKYKGQLYVAFDKTESNSVEIQVSMSKKFYDDETLSFTVEGKGVQGKYIKLGKEWDKLTKYVRVRYYKYGPWYDSGDKQVFAGKWSEVKAVNP